MNDITIEPYKDFINELDLTGIIPERLEICITVMQRVHDNNYKFGMRYWQDLDTAVGAKSTEAELKDCGTPACFGGWLAVSPEFIALGGLCIKDGSPVFHCGTENRAISNFLFCNGNDQLGYELTDGGSGLYDDVKPSNITAAHVLERLEYINEVT